ncbi:phage portal protein family protein [Paenibacillus sp. DYY-L-2]|uniref:phage portal protein family protein n=1 Tax=Paenibacillus sp. DYY-L-2 TaxID=3447013 RepID=UPI003F4FB757
MILGPDGRPIQKPDTSEIARVLNTFGAFMKSLPNPDIILKKTGKSAEIFEEMKTDAHVWAELTKRKSGVLSKDWDVLPASDDKRDLEIAAFVKETFERLNFDQDMRQMLDAVFAGRNIHELIWTERDGHWTIANMKDRPIEYFTFDIDGNLRFLKSSADIEGEPVPPGKFLTVVHESGDDHNPYGVALATKCFWAWQFKKHGFKFWAIFMEKYGMPTAIGKYQPGTSQADQDRLLDALVSLVQDAAVAIPANSSVDFIEAGDAKGDAHEAFLRFCNAEISKAILGQTLTTELPTGGSFAASKTHEGVKDEIIEADAKMLMSAINTDLIPFLVAFNFGEVESYPFFHISYETEEVHKEWVERDEKLVNMGVPISVDYFYEKYNIPRPGKDDVLVKKAEVAPSPLFAEQNVSQKARKTHDHDRELHVVQFAASEDDQLERADQLQLLFARSVDTAQPIVRRMWNHLVQQVREWQDFGAADVKRLQPDRDAIAELAELMNRTGIVAYAMGEYGAHLDYLKAEREGSASFADEDDELTYKVIAKPVKFEEAIRYFSQLMPLNIEQYRKLNEELKAKHFTLAGVQSQDMVRAIHEALLASLEQGTTFDDFLKAVNAKAEALGIAEADPWHMETVFRNQIQTAYETGQYEKLQQPEMADMFPFYRYSAVLDSGTRASHRAMNGLIAHRDDPIWQEWWPPNGHRCRCGVIAINKYRAAREGITPANFRPDVSPDPGWAKSPSVSLREVPESVKDREE